MAKSKKATKKSRHLHPLLTILILIIVAIILFLAINSFQNNKFQSGINNFYNTNDLPPNGPLGEVIRNESVSTKLQNGTAHRIVYRTQ